MTNYPAIFLYQTIRVIRHQYKHVQLTLIVGLCQTNSLSLPLIDIDECSIPEGVICHENAKCENTQGTFMCVCNVGFTGDGINNCTGKVLQIFLVNF